MSDQMDHRPLADEMELFVFDEQIGAGLPLWLPRGVALRDELEGFVKRLEREAGYQRVVSPHIARASLYEMSGHLRAFGEDMYPPMRWQDGSSYYLKPMNCPHHHKIFASSLRSYKQLPLRFAEYGQVYRYENSGSLRGLSRVRGLCQNDAHIYVEPAKAAEEILRILELHEHCYAALGLKNYRYRLSLHDPQSMEKFDGPLELWRESEEILRQSLIAKKRPFYEAVGEAAFYGPKIDVQMPMGQGNEESIASIQIDFNSAEKFDLNYIAKSGQKERPWVIHRAPLGSHERFVALLLEYYQGKLPGWLSPVQVLLIPVSDEQVPFARDLAQKLLQQNIRCEVDENAGSLSKRILFSHRFRPFVRLVLGQKEIHQGEFGLQLRGEKKIIPQDELISALKDLLAPPA